MTGARVLCLAEIVARIDAAGIYRSTGGAADLARAGASGAIGGAAAFVLPGSEAAAPSGIAGGVQHRAVEARFIVLSVAEDIRSDAGAGALSALERVRGELIAALAGFRPAWADSPAAHERGQLVTGPMPGGRLGWQDEFTIRFRRRLPQGD